MTTPSPYGQPEYPDAGQQPGYGTGVAPKSKTTAALLAFFLGDFGAHNFYRGQKGRGFGHLALFIISIIAFIMAGVSLASNLDAYGNVSDSGAVGLGIGGFVGYLMVLADGIWAFVEFIMILVSKDGTLQ